MAGPIKLPQGVPLKEAPPDLNPFWAALASGADQGMDPTTEAIAASIPRRRTADIELPGMPEPPAAPAEFRTAPAAMQALSEASLNRNVPPEVLEQMKIRSGFKIPEGIDWESERAGFLAQGNADREAEDAAMSGGIAQSIFPWGRTVNDRVRDDTAFRGLQEARSMTDPGYRRQQRQQDTIAQAQTFMDPTVARARAGAREDQIAEARGLKELGITFGLDPRARQLEDEDFQRRLRLEEIRASGRNPLGAMLGGGNTSAPRGTQGTVTMQEVQGFAKEQGISVEQAIAQIQGEGFTVAR